MIYLLNKYDFPQINGVSEDIDFSSFELVPFNFVLSKKAVKENSIVHFFIYDYQFERVWRRPLKYIEPLRRYKYVLSPDFSLYLNMPLGYQIYQTLRNRVIGALWERRGLKVIPSISWADERSFEFCCDGVKKKSVVAISTVGVRDWDLFEKGLDFMIRALTPKAILCYGTDYIVDYSRVYYFKPYIYTIREKSKKGGEKWEEEAEREVLREALEEEGVL